MKVAVIGSRNLNVKKISHFIPAATTEIVSGGAKGVDTAAKKYSDEYGCKYTEFLPDYKKYGRAAPLKRNDEIIDYADMVVAIWDSSSKGTKYVIDKCKKLKKCLLVYNVHNVENTILILTDKYEYFNMTTLSDKTLKEMIICELDCEMHLDVKTELINECIKAILINKPDIQYADSFKKIFDKLEAESEDMLNQVTKKYLGL